MFASLDTPCLVVDEARMTQNLSIMQERARALGKALRPHSKTHKMPVLARRQMDLGATGVMVAKLDEAAVMLAGGVTQQSVGYPLIGPIKELRLAGLMAKGLRPRVSVDSMPALVLLERAAAAAGRELDALIEVNTGLNRAGLRDADEIAQLAQRIRESERVHYRGLTCFGGHIGYQPTEAEALALVRDENALLDRIAAHLTQNRLAPEVISEGGTILAHYAEQLRVATEIRPGTYIFNDVATVASRAAEWKDCAATIVTTVVGRPDPKWAVIDAGAKTLSLDPAPTGGFGQVEGRPDLLVARLTEEHGIVVDRNGGGVRLQIGDRLRIVPNHVCATVNLHDRAVFVDGEAILYTLPIEGRGGVH